MKELVFIIEDDITQQKLLRHHFEEALGSYSVRCFENPADMMDKLNEKPFAIVLDHFFSDKNKTGFDYLLLIKKKYPSIPVIYHTSMNDDGLKAKVIKAGAEQFIIKDGASLVRLRTALDTINEKKGKKGFFSWLK